MNALLACVASVPVLYERRAFSAFWPRENWGERNKVGGGRGWGALRSRKKLFVRTGTLATQATAR